MPCGSKLIEVVASELSVTTGKHPWQIELGLPAKGMKASRRAVRYAVTELLKTGRAIRLGAKGVVYAAPEIPAAETHTHTHRESA